MSAAKTLLFGTFAVVGVPLMDGISDPVTNGFGVDHFIYPVVSLGTGFIIDCTILKYKSSRSRNKHSQKVHWNTYKPEW